jgi:hypothetical protein
VSVALEFSENGVPEKFDQAFLRSTGLAAIGRRRVCRRTRCARYPPPARDVSSIGEHCLVFVGGPDDVAVHYQAVGSVATMALAMIM